MLTSTQQQVMQGFKKDIDYARNCETYDQYIDNSNYSNAFKKMYKENKNMKQHYLNEQIGIVLAMTSSNTLVALEKKGFIQIIKDSANQYCGVDVIQVLNY